MSSAVQPKLSMQTIPPPSKLCRRPHRFVLATLHAVVAEATVYTTNSGVMVQTPRRESLEIRLRHELNGMRDLNDDAAASWKKAADDAAELRRQIVRQWCSLWCSVFLALCARMVSQSSLTHRCTFAGGVGRSQASRRAQGIACLQRQRGDATRP